ncbi:MAG: ParA family protein [Gammaproteobacteria bacterium]|nr:ParA family protein [Gammaproteobacteria bacterium]
MIVCATYNLKGGVGKTTAAVNLAHLSSRGGRRTLVWDLDPQGAATYYLRGETLTPRTLDSLLDKKRGLVDAVRATDYVKLDLLPASLAYRNLDVALTEFKRPTKRLAKLLEPFRDRYDLAILDCAPNLSVTSENVFELADWLLIPLIPTPLSLRAYEQLQQFCGAGPAAPKLVPFFSMVDRRRQLHCDLVADFASAHPEILRTFVPYTSQVERMGEHRSPVQVYAPSSPGARAFAALWIAVCERLGIAPELPSAE